MPKKTGPEKTNSVIVYLARSAEADVKDLTKSLALLKKNFLKKFSYPVIVFVEDSFSEDWKKQVRSESGVDCRFETVHFEIPSFLASQNFPEYVLEPKFNMGYRHMCRFFSGAIYQEPALRDYKWYWRLDTDSFVTGRVRYDVFKFMEQNGLKYGYSWVTHDSPVVTEGLWSLTKRFLEDNRIQPEFLGKYLDSQGEWDLSIFYTNFEISDLDMWRSGNFKKYFDFIDRDGGIYRHRWGDTPIHLLAVSSFLPEDQTHCFSDIPYKHQGFIIDPDKNKWHRRVYDRIYVIFKRLREEGIRISFRRYLDIADKAMRDVAKFFIRLYLRWKPGFNFRHKTCDFSTHQPVLHKLIKITDGPILELGCGRGSTPLLAYFAKGRKIVTVDNDSQWLERFRWRYESKNHRFIFTEDWEKTLNDPLLDQKWSLIIVDQSPWDARYRSILRFKDSAEYIMLHDSDYFPGTKVFGREIEPTVAYKYGGKRDYSDIFKYSREYHPPLPWPAPSGPPTLVGSNFKPCDVHVDFETERLF